MSQVVMVVVVVVASQQPPGQYKAELDQVEGWKGSWSKADFNDLKDEGIWCGLAW